MQYIFLSFIKPTEFMTMKLKSFDNIDLYVKIKFDCFYVKDGNGEFS